MTDSAILDRRDFAKQTLGAVLTFSLLETLTTNDLLADSARPITSEWVKSLNDLSKQVKGEKLKQIEWQKQVEELFSKIDLPNLLRLIDFDKLTKNVKFAANGARSLRPKFPKVEGIPTDLVFGRQIFALKKDRSVVPHGHDNMATAFLILKGDLHGRHYDRLKDEQDHFLIKPTIDRKFKPAEYSTVSDFRDNVHWFKAVSDSAFIFNIHVLNLKSGGKKRTGRVYLDPAGEKLSGGLIKARRIDYKEAHKLYG